MSDPQLLVMAFAVTLAASVPVACENEPPAVNEDAGDTRSDQRDLARDLPTDNPPAELDEGGDAQTDPGEDPVDAAEPDLVEDPQTDPGADPDLTPDPVDDPDLPDTPMDPDLTDPVPDLPEEPDEPDYTGPTTVQAAFRYLGSGGAAHYLDDVHLETRGIPLLDESFEYGRLPDDWSVEVDNESYTWAFLDSPRESHTGDYCAKVEWHYDQDEWLITPPFEDTGTFTLTFWNKGVVGFAEDATLRVYTSCDAGTSWDEVYRFPGADETENFTWYEETIRFECP